MDNPKYYERIFVNDSTGENFILHDRDPHLARSRAAFASLKSQSLGYRVTWDDLLNMGWHGPISRSRFEAMQQSEHAEVELVDLARLEVAGEENVPFKSFLEDVGGAGITRLREYR